MAVLVTGKVIADTNVFTDYLRDDRSPEWIFGGTDRTVRFLSAVVLMELRLGCDTPARTRAVDRILRAFPANRVVAPGADLFGRAGQEFQALYGTGPGMRDRLGRMNDLLIALTAWSMGATVVTRNAREFERIAKRLRGLRIVAPTM